MFDMIKDGESSSTGHKLKTMKRYLFGAIIVALGVMPLVSFAQIAPLTYATCTDFTTNLDTGPSGDLNVVVQVLNVQLALSKEGFGIDPSELGTFGASTKVAVRSFQEKYSDDILVPIGAWHGTGYFGTITRLKMQALYGCRKTVSTLTGGKINLAVTNLILDGNGVSVTVCNRGSSDLLTTPFRIRLNGINRDFDALGAHKAGSCATDTWKYETWGLVFNPGSTFTAVTLIDPTGLYKTSLLEYPISYNSSYTVPALPGAHLAVRSLLLKSAGLQATFCNLGTVNLPNFPVRVTMNGISKDFDVSEVYGAGKCYPKQWAYDNWGISYKSGATYNAVVSVDPDDTYQETNKFDNVATVVGAP